MKLFEKLFSGKEISGRAWVISSLVGIVLVLLFIGSMNYFVDPFSYFRFMDGEFTEFQDASDTYLRYIKAKQIQHAGDKYDAYIIGGSKSGALRTQTLKEVEGLDYYNCWILSGNFREYYLYTKFILENTSAKKILLQISGPEVKRGDVSTFGDMYKTPAVISGESEAAEVFEFLGKNVSVAWGDLMKKIKGEKLITIPGIEDGVRNINYYYKRIEKDPDEYVQTAVLHDYDANLDKLFNKTPKNAERFNNLEYLKEIKSMCEDAGVELQVFIGASCINELNEYEARTYWSYLLQIVDIFDNIWDFSGYNDVCMNPYNFYNESHYKYEVGDLMIRTMAKGEQIVEGFGTYVTPKTRFTWLDSRRKAYNRLKTEYNNTGTIDLSMYTYEDRIK